MGLLGRGLPPRSCPGGSGPGRVWHLPPEISRVLGERQPDALVIRDSLRARPKFGPKRTVGWGVLPLSTASRALCGEDGCRQTLMCSFLGLLSPPGLQRSEVTDEPSRTDLKGRLSRDPCQHPSPLNPLSLSFFILERGAYESCQPHGGTEMFRTKVRRRSLPSGGCLVRAPRA